jgi:serine protease
MKNLSRIYVAIIFSTCTFVLLKGQNSFLVQVEARFDDTESANLRSSSSSLKIKNIIQSPMNIILVEGNNELRERDVLRALESRYRVLAIQKNRKLKNRTLPNDTLYNKQWQYKNTGENSNGGVVGADISAEAAWNITTGGKTPSGKEIVVAVIDDGAPINHPDLQANLWKNKNEIPNNKIDDDGNGYIDDFNGWNAIDKNDKIDSDASHGSQVAGIVGAKGNNGIGVTGVNWDVKIMPIYYGSATEANAIASYAYAYNQRKLYNETQGRKGAFIVATNASWGVDGGKAEEAPLWCAMYDSLGSVGILNVAATANQNVDVEIEGDLPTTCGSDYLLSITNINKFNQRANAAFGKKSIDLAAYGDGVYTINKTNYNTFNGTSAAAPHVAGALALMYSVKCNFLDSLANVAPANAALAIRDLVLNNVSRNQIYETLTTTEGVLNLNKAVNAALNQCGSSIAISGIKHSILDKKSIKIEWLTASGLKQIRFKKSDDLATWTSSSFFSQDNYLLNTLDFCNEYTYQVRQIIGTDTSDWSSYRYVKTEGCCTAPTQTKFAIEDKSITVEGVAAQKYLIYITNNLGKTDSLFFTGKTVLTKLIDCSEYKFSIAEYCPVQARYSNLSTPITRSSFCGECSRTYCPSGSYDNTSEWIEEVTINNVRNATGRTSSGFGEHIGATIPQVKKGDSITVDIKPGFKGSSFREHYGVYVDWNSNGEFSSDENVFQTKESINGIVNLKFGVPATALYGLTRMRVILSYTGSQAGCRGNSEYGETEDYCINIINEVSAPFLEKLTSVQIWPNPTSGFINIRNAVAIDKLSIIDYLGKVLYNRPEGLPVGDTKLELPLLSGMYMVIFEQDGMKRMTKLIVD